MTLEEKVKKYHLFTETYKQIENDENYLNLVTQERYWENVLNCLSKDNEQIRDYFNSLELQEREDYFQFGISCLLCFIQKNFTGPQIPKTIDEFLEEEIFKSVDFANCLQIDDEEINVNTKHSMLLLTSSKIFQFCVIEDLVNYWWSCRALMIHQEVLDEISSKLLSYADDLSKSIQLIPLEGQMKAELDIELAQLYLKFRQISKSKNYIASASDILGLEYNLVGKLGKRTRYQQNEVPQLALNISLQERKNIERPEIDDLIIPKNLSLDDDIRLDKIEFSDAVSTVKLSNTEQKLVLSIVQQTIISTPQDELQVEELSPFLEVILSQENTYSVRVVALLLRCRFERKHRRTIERCIKQCEDIVGSFNEEKPHALNRIGDVLGTSFSPVWKVEGKYADILLDFGLVKNALDVYLRAKLWEDVIICYSILNLRHKAAEVIKEQLAIKQTVKMMCLLGDATDDLACYEKAWQMSEGRSFRAQRHWGQYFYNRRKYNECIPHYEKSLSINYLQADIWLRLGFAALQVENWSTAYIAYQRYTTLEPESFEAWNNLAKACIKVGNKQKAHQAILEALKYNFDNWKIWENLLLISCDLADFGDVIRAYHRVLDLKEKYLDVEVLNILVHNVSEENMLQKTRELLGRVTVLYPTVGAVWELYAKITPMTLPVQLVQRLQRAYKGYTQTGWDKSPEACRHVLNICKKLGSVVLDDAIDPADNVVNSVKLNLSSALVAVRRHNYEEMNDLEKEVETQLEEIKEKIKNGRSTVKAVTN